MIFKQNPVNLAKNSHIITGCMPISGKGWGRLIAGGVGVGVQHSTPILPFPLWLVFQASIPESPGVEIDTVHHASLTVNVV